MCGNLEEVSGASILSLLDKQELALVNGNGIG